MKEKVNNFIRSRVFIIILVLVLVCTTLLLGTYAWFTWSSTDNTTLVMSLGEFADVYFKSGNTIDGELAPVYEYTDGLSTTFSINNRDTSGTMIGYSVKFNITSIASELISEDVKYTLVKNGNVVSEGNLSSVSDGSSITLDSGAITMGTTNFVFYLYIDGNVENDLSMMGKTITGNIMVEANGNGVNLLNHITDLYTTSSKTEVVNNGITYNYAPSVRLMNDRLGDATVDADSGDIRYYGADDSNLNNYIYFNCSDYYNQSSSTCEVWRIIGIVDGKVKLIRSGSLGEYAWDADDYTNNWSTSTLNTYLNGDYYGSLSTMTQGLISNSTYYLGGYNTSERYSNQIYNYERTNESGTTILSGNPFTVDTNIGIMYASDYGYATDFNECDSNLYHYDNEECYSNDWLFSSDFPFFITPNPDVSYYSWFIGDSGYVGEDFEIMEDNNGSVRPVLYLEPEVIVNKGDGSSDNPYQIYVAPKEPSVAFEYITSLYNDADKTETTKDSVVYNFATSVSLMNDRMGGTTDDYDGGNIRYYGADPNNYIYFNCNDYSNQTAETCEIWKIIGVFDDKLKIIRGESIGQYAWDRHDQYEFAWDSSTLKEMLNEDYYSNNSENYSGLELIGLKNDETRNFISSETWYLGGVDSFTGGGKTAEQFYDYERSGHVYIDWPESWEGKIALLYPSDYLYSYGTGNSSYLNIDDYGVCYETDNWYCASSVIWTIMHSSDNIFQAFGITGSFVDTIDGSDEALYVYLGGAVLPTLYLKSELQFNGVGNGSSGNPYQLLVS